MIDALLRRDLLVVTGKGGVGKTTVAAALALAAARRGQRAIVVEVAARDELSRALSGETAGLFAEREVAPNLFHVSIDPQHAMEEYLVDQLPVKALADALVRSRLFTYLAAATPGFRELLTAGKVWELAQPERRTPGARPYDLVVLDAPATGHGLALLSAPRTFAGAAHVGPIARQGRTIHAMLSDTRRTGVVAVSTAEELAVNETLALRKACRAATGLPLAAVVLNGRVAERFSAEEAAALGLSATRAAPPCAGESTPAAGAPAPTAGAPTPTGEDCATTLLAGPARRAVRSQVHRARAQTVQAERLRAALPQRMPLLELPLLVAPALGAEELGELADELCAC